MSAYEIKRAVGLDPESVGLVGLNSVGVYPVTEVTQPYNTDLYSVALTYTINGSYADQTWTPTAKTLADVIEAAQGTRLRAAAGVMRKRRISTAHNDMSVLVSGTDAANYTYWTGRASTAALALDSELDSIESAATVDDINNIVSAAWGTIALRLDEANPLNLLAGDFDEFYSKNYSEASLELYFPGTATTVAYSSGFAATASAVSADDPTVQLRVTATGVVVDEFVLTTADSTDFSNNPENYISNFGYKEYPDFGDNKVDLSAILDAAAVVRANSVSPKFTGTINAVDGTFTGTLAAPTAAPGTNPTQVASTAFVAAAVAALVDASPATLDTLNELAAALNDDANFATTVTDAIALKLDSAGAAEALDVDHLITLSGVAAASDNLGTFTGSTITDNVTVKAALQELETAVDSLGGGGGDTLSDVRSFVGGSAGDTHLGTLSGNVITDGVSVKTALQEIEIRIEDHEDGTTNFTGFQLAGTAVTATGAELNILDGVTATAAELNLLDGVTATTAELNYVDGVTSAIQTQLDAKAALASPALTGTPTAPTAAVNTNTTQLATTAFVVAEVSNELADTANASSMRTALGITENAGDPADGRGLYYDTSASKYLLSS